MYLSQVYQEMNLTSFENVGKTFIRLLSKGRTHYQNKFNRVLTS